MSALWGKLKAATFHLLGGADGRISWGKLLTLALLAANQTGHPVSDALGVAILGYAYGRSYLASKDTADAA